MNEKNRRVASLLFLALFICLVGFANAAIAGKGGSNNAEKTLQEYFYLKSLNSNPNS